jgi:hypothetical protein
MFMRLSGKTFRESRILIVEECDLEFETNPLADSFELHVMDFSRCNKPYREARAEAEAELLTSKSGPLLPGLRGRKTLIARRKRHCFFASGR